MPNEKTKAALKGYVMALVNEASASIETNLPKLRAAIESDNEDDISTLARAVGEDIRCVLTAVQHREDVMPERQYFKKMRVSDALLQEADLKKD